MPTTRHQLDLFTKRRAKRPPPALERATHIAVADTIRVSLTPGWIAFHVPNGEYRELKTAGVLKRMLVLPGVSDFVFIAPPDGRAHTLELKRRGNRPTDPQNAFLEAVRAAGGQSDWADNFDDAIRILKGWGAVRVRL